MDETDRSNSALNDSHNITPEMILYKALGFERLGQRERAVFYLEQAASMGEPTVQARAQQEIARLQSSMKNVYKTVSQ